MLNFKSLKRKKQQCKENKQIENTENVLSLSAHFFFELMAGTLGNAQIFPSEIAGW